MAMTLNIIITGVAICYKKPQPPDNVENYWRVLFPFDEKVGGKRCHPVNFTWRKNNGNLHDEGSLAESMREITITRTSGVPKAAPDETADFEKCALDLTNRTNAAKPKTHAHVQLLSSPADPDKWKKGTALLKIEGPAQMDVLNYVPKRDDHGVLSAVFEHDGLGAVQKHSHGILAHDVVIVMEFPDAGTVTVTTNEPNPLSIEFSEQGVHTLKFDNDCKTVREGINDMDMFYENTISDADPATEKRRFLVGDRAPVIAAKAPPPSIPASFAEGKPCLAVTVTDVDSIVKLP